MPLTKIVNSNVDVNAIANNAFTNLSVTGLKIADKALTNSKFANLSINPQSVQNLDTQGNIRPLIYDSTGSLAISEDLNFCNNRVISYYTGGAYYLTNSFDWFAGAYVDFTPTSVNSYLRFTAKIGHGYYNSHTISHWIFYANNTEICKFSNSDLYDEKTWHFERIVPSWGTTNGRIGLQARRYGGSNQHQFMTTNWWVNGYGDNLDGATARNRTIQGECTVEELPNRSRLTITSGITFPQGMIATGGDVIYDIGDNRVHVFENSGTFNITQLGTDPSRGNKIWYTVVAGGGGGGMDMGGGGGGGGVIENQCATVLTGNCTVVVGAGGAGSPGPYNGPPPTGSVGGDSFLYLTTPLSAGQTNVTSVDYLVVAGGGGGGMDMGGGGGGGGVLSGTLPIIAGQSYTVVVGAGGAGAPAGGTFQQSSTHQFNIAAGNGGNSQFATFTAIGGGRGGSSYYQYNPGPAGCAGGSGGGASGYSDGSASFRDGGAGTAGQGFRGGRGGPQYYSGGGGGAGGQGVDSTARSDGGPGILNNITGDNYYWAGGGGGAGHSRESGNGGIGGGGGGSGGGLRGQGGGSAYNVGSPGGGDGGNTPGGDAGENTGGGGGGSAHYNSNNRGGFGGSGIVVVRYQGVQRAHGGDRIYQRVIGGVQYTIHEFLTPGTWQFINSNQQIIQARGGGGAQSGHYRSTGTSGERYIGPNPTRGGSGGGASATHNVVGIRYGGKNIAGQGTSGGASAGTVDYYGGSGGGASFNSPTTDGNSLANGRASIQSGIGGDGYYSYILGIEKCFGGGGGAANYTGPGSGPAGMGGGGGGSRYDDSYGSQGGAGGQSGSSQINYSSPNSNWRWMWDSSGEAGYNGSSIRGGNGAANTGGGGGGGTHAYSTGGNGGKGIVIVRYKYTNNKSRGLLGTIENPANNAREILAARPGAPSGDYFLWVDGEPTSIYCDMTSFGGGWVLVAVGREGAGSSVTVKWHTQWFANAGGGNYKEGLRQANLAAVTSNFVPRYLPSGVIHGIKGEDTWNNMEMIINRVQLNDSFYLRSPGSRYVFGWADFCPILSEKDQSVLNNPNNCGFSFNNPVGRAPDSTTIAILPLTYSRYPNLWAGGSPIYTYNNALWPDTQTNGLSNDSNRMFTWNWSGHQGWTGFSTGASICGPGFQAGTECHAIQFVNIFVR